MLGVRAHLTNWKMKFGLVGKLENEFGVGGEVDVQDNEDPAPGVECPLINLKTGRTL